MAEIEFEQKYLLQLPKCHKLISYLENHKYPRVGIRQYYLPFSDERMRSVEGYCTLEKKQGIKLGAAYSVNVEETRKVSNKIFEQGWKRTNLKLTKQRYKRVLARDKRLDIDFFLTKTKTAIQFNKDFYCYAIVAEVEIIINQNTIKVDFDFSLPSFLEPFLLSRIDKTDKKLKMFKSSSMVDNPRLIKSILKKQLELENDRSSQNIRATA